MKNINTKVVIAELHRAFKMFNENLFESQLPEPAILIQSRGNKKLTLGWCSVQKIWKNEKTEEEKYEINIVAEALNRGVFPVMTTLLHEMVHLHNLVNEIKDTSRGNTYHNMKFKKTAEAHGLLVEHADKIGWSVSKLSGLTMDLIDSHRFDEAVFSLGRRDLDFEGPGKPRKKKKTSSRKYYCPRCGCIIRASKQVNVICGDCYTKDNLLMYFVEETEPDTDEYGNPAITIEPTDYEPVEPVEPTEPEDMEGTGEVEADTIEIICPDCGCISEVNQGETICPECGFDVAQEINEPKEIPALPITEEPMQLDDGAGNMVDVLQGKIEVINEMLPNQKRVAEAIAKEGFVIGCYDKKMEELKYMALMKVVDNALILEYTDVHIKIKGVEHVVEISTVGNEKDFTVYTLAEYIEKYGERED